MISSRLNRRKEPCCSRCARVSFIASNAVTSSRLVKWIGTSNSSLNASRVLFSPIYLSTKRAPSWTDRILYTTHTDDPEKPNESNIFNALYTSIPSYCTSDHKPIVALLLVPTPTKPTGASPPVLRLPVGFTPVPDTSYMWKRIMGRRFVESESLPQGVY